MADLAWRLAYLPGFGHSEGRPDVLTPTAMGEFLGHFISKLGLGKPYLVAPDVGASAALFLAARHPDAVTGLVIGGGGAAYPLEVTGILADIIAAPGIEVFRGMDRATLGASVEPAAAHDQEPEVWEDYVSGYENGRFAESARYVRSYPEQLPLLRDLLPGIQVPVHVFASADDPLVPVSNGEYLAQQRPHDRPARRRLRRARRPRGRAHSRLARSDRRTGQRVPLPSPLG
jgi:pimeloyl-ACP methyl ester carboxylesterase